MGKLELVSREYGFGNVAQKCGCLLWLCTKAGNGGSVDLRGTPLWVKASMTTLQHIP